MENIIQLLNDRLSTINETQTVFMVFYAIVWGAIANVQPRWKAFQWPLFFVDWRVTLRIFVSFTVFNVLPLLFFGWTLMILGSNQHHILRWNIDSAVSVFHHGVLPAFANFGFYRLWLGIVELTPTWFYREWPNQIPDWYPRNEPTVASLWYRKTPYLDRGDYKIKIYYDPITIWNWGILNLIWSGFYFLIAVGCNMFSSRVHLLISVGYLLLAFFLSKLLGIERSNKSK